MSGCAAAHIAVANCEGRAFVRDLALRLIGTSCVRGTVHAVLRYARTCATDVFDVVKLNVGPRETGLSRV